MIDSAAPSAAAAPVRKPSAFVYVVATLVVLALIAAVILGVKGKDYLIGAKVGEACEKPSDCASGSLFSTPICIADPGTGAGYCSKECESDSDCPASLSCVAIDGIVLARGNKACGRR